MSDFPHPEPAGDVCCADCAKFAMLKKETYIGGDARSMFSHSKGPFCRRDEFAIPAHRDSLTGENMPRSWKKRLCGEFNKGGNCPHFTPAPPAPPESAKTGILLMSRLGAGIVGGAFAVGFVLGLLPWVALVPIGIIALAAVCARYCPDDFRIV